MIFSTLGRGLPIPRCCAYTPGGFHDHGDHHSCHLRVAGAALRRWPHAVGHWCHRHCLVGCETHWRRPQGSWTWGWKRAEIMSAAVNGVTLLVVAILVGIEAVRRLVTPPAVGGPGHCHSRPHPDRPICPNRPVPTPHHPIPPLGTQPVQRRPHRPSHRPLTISEAPLTRRQSGSVFEPVTNTRPSTALRPSFLTKTDQWEAFFPQNRTSAGARDPSPVKAP